MHCSSPFTNSRFRHESFTLNIRSSDTFYNSNLIADPSAAFRGLSDFISPERLSQIPAAPLPVLWLDTAGNEEAHEDNLAKIDDTRKLWASSKSNRYEAIVLLKYLEYLSHLVDPINEHVGVITPYNAQVELLKRTLFEVIN